MNLSSKDLTNPAWRAAVAGASVRLTARPNAGPHTWRYTIPVAAIGKPRMTRRDKWAKRPCVVAYREFADALRAACGYVPEAGRVDELRVTATYVPPVSWSKRERAAAIGQKKRTKPDGDNILKAIQDPLWSCDEALGDIGHVRRRWGERDELVIEIDVVPGVAAGGEGR